MGRGLYTPRGVRGLVRPLSPLPFSRPLLGVGGRGREASPLVAAQLQARVKRRIPTPFVPKDRVRVVNQGVCPGEKTQTLPFYTFSGAPGLPSWATQIGSFDLDFFVCARKFPGNFPEMIGNCPKQIRNTSGQIPENFRTNS